MLMNEATQAYVRQHEKDEIRGLALQGTKDPEVDLTLALQQIAGRQTARRKLPTWADVQGVVYPPHLNMEQCSSEQTARYKASLLTGGQRYVDLTGGFGVDFYFMSQGYQERCYVEQDSALCALAEHNFQQLGLSCSVNRGTASVYLTEMKGRADVIYLDPARRDVHGARTYGIADCTPNVLELLPVLLKKSETIVLKLSPMLDWRKAVSDLGCVSEVHIVSVDNECKELLLILHKEVAPALQVVCVNNDSRFVFATSLQSSSPLLTELESAPYGNRVCSLRNFSCPLAGFFLYEPNASVMKAGCFDELSQRFAVCQVSDNSHLFLSTAEVTGFPGRRFQIETITTMNKKELKTTLAGIQQANIAVRNFPLTVQQLRQKLKIKDGGDVYIFATTLQNGEHKLFICRKIG